MTSVRSRASQKSSCLLLLCVVIAMGCMDAQINDTSQWGAQGTSVGGKSDEATFDEPPVPMLHEAYWLTGQSRLLVEDVEDGDPHEIISYFSALVTLGQDGRDLTLILQPCDIVLPKVDDKDLELDLDAIQALDSGPLLGGLVPSEEGDGWDLWTEETVMLLGVDLDDPHSDSMPTHKNDPAAVDVDDDGKPGISVGISAFKIYAAFRFRIALSARLTEHDGFVGETSLEAEFQILGDNIPFFDAKKAADEAMDGVVVVDELHSFTMIPIRPEDATCEGPIGNEEHVSMSD
jgi:hypothetical protein